MIPLGGYVKMLDERVEEVPEHLLNQAFNRKTVWQRIAIVAAGPIANFIFAILVLFVMYFIGVPSLKPVIDGTKPDSPASKIIVKEPTQILAVDGKPVRDWEEVNLALIGEIGAQQLTLKVAQLSQNLDASNELSASQGKTYRLDTRNWKFDPDKESAITALGLNIYRPKVESIVAQVSDGSAAQFGGVLAGDKIVSINGQPYSNWTEFVKLIQQSPEKTLAFVVERAGSLLTLEVTPKAVKNSDGEVIGQVGIAPKQPKWPENMRIQMEYGIVGSFTNALNRTWELTAVSLKTMAKLFTGDVSVKSLSGPISIAQGAGRSADYGFVRFLGFLALISVSLGIINLMPVPVLDGGHLLYYFVEVITGKPVPEKIQDIGFRIGAALLLMLMSVAIFNDFSRL